MKFNLKNLPSNDGVDCVDWTIAMRDWLEGLEKELRKRLAFGEKCEQAWLGAKKHRIDKELAMEWHGANLEIQQFLGEVGDKSLR